jgi:hypothetical protein
MLLSLMGEGKGEFDHSAIATFVESSSHVEIKKPC